MRVVRALGSKTCRVPGRAATKPACSPGLNMLFAANTTVVGAVTDCHSFQRAA
jgi:hypothetical protein